MTDANCAVEDRKNEEKCRREQNKMIKCIQYNTYIPLLSLGYAVVVKAYAHASAEIATSL